MLIFGLYNRIMVNSRDSGTKFLDLNSHFYNLIAVCLLARYLLLCNLVALSVK